MHHRRKNENTLLSYKIRCERVDKNDNKKMLSAYYFIRARPLPES